MLRNVKTAQQIVYTLKSDASIILYCFFFYFCNRKLCAHYTASAVLVKGRLEKVLRTARGVQSAVINYCK